MPFCRLCAPCLLSRPAPQQQCQRGRVPSSVPWCPLPCCCAAASASAAVLSCCWALLLPGPRPTVQRQTAGRRHLMTGPGHALLRPVQAGGVCVLTGQGSTGDEGVGGRWRQEAQVRSHQRARMDGVTALTTHVNDGSQQCNHTLLALIKQILLLHYLSYCSEHDGGCCKHALTRLGPQPPYSPVCLRTHTQGWGPIHTPPHVTTSHHTSTHTHTHRTFSGESAVMKATTDLATFGSNTRPGMAATGLMRGPPPPAAPELRL